MDEQDLQTRTKVLICPYCGDTQPAGDRCRACGGLFEPLSRQASHNAMGPWFIRDERRPFTPGASYETLIKLVERGQVTKYSIIRSPTTKQFWTVAKRVPGIAHLLGYCHNCDASVDPGDHGCHACGVPFGAYLDRNYLGLPDVRPLPWEAPVTEEDRASGRQVGQAFDFRRAAEPMSLSSFATDEELRDPGGSGMSIFAPPVSQHVESFASTSTVFQPQEHSVPPYLPAMSGVQQPLPGAQGSLAAAVLDTSPAGVAARAMQRRLERQRQQNRMLLIAVFVLAALAVVAFAAYLAKRGESMQGSSPSVAATSSDAKQLPPQPSLKKPEPEAGNPAPSTSVPTISPVPAADAASTKPDHPSYDAEFARAQELISRAEEKDRPLLERIRDYEEAVAILKNIDAHAEPDRKPAGLAEKITQSEKTLERLRLQEFFP